MAVVQPKLWNSISIASTGAADLDAITMLPNGGYVVTFRQDQKVAFQIYDGKGHQVGGTHFVTAPTANTLAQWEPDILTYKADGSFVITWTEATAASGGGRILRNQVFDMAGTPGTVKTMYSTTVTDGAHLSTNGQDGWATAYTTSYTTPGGTPTIAVEFVVNNNNGSQSLPISVSIASGVDKPDITWIGGTSYAVSCLTTGVNSGFQFSVLDSSGQFFGSLSIPQAVEADVAALMDPATGNPTGQFVVAHRSTSGAIISNVYQVVGDQIQAVQGRSFELFPATANLSSAEYKVDVTALHDGGYAVAYMAPGADLNNIWVRVFDKDGNTTTQAFEINIPLNLQKTPAIHEMADGRLVVSWHDPSVGVGQIETVIVDARAAAVTVAGTTSDDIYAPSAHTGDNFDGGDGVDTLTFQGAGAGVAVNLAAESGSAGDAAGDTYKNFENIIGSGFDDSLTGNALSNVIQGGSGHDVLNGAGGSDRLEGGVGNDVYYVDTPWDLVLETSIGGSDQVYASSSYTLAAYVEKLIGIGSGAISLTGNSLNNTLTGNTAANVLKGSTGHDTLNGGLGNDQLWGGTGADKFVFTTAPNAWSNKDKILDWNYREDTILLENAIFRSLTKTGVLNAAFFKLGAGAGDSNDFVGYNKLTGDVWYDSNANRAGGQVVFANIGKYKAIFSSDFVIV